MPLAAQASYPVDSCLEDMLHAHPLTTPHITHHTTPYHHTTTLPTARRRAVRCLCLCLPWSICASAPTHAHNSRPPIRLNRNCAACSARRLVRPPPPSAPPAGPCGHDLLLWTPQDGHGACSQCAPATDRLGSQWLPLTSLQAPTGPAAGSAPVKKDPNALDPTPLEKLLANAGPLRSDGSDKFFGFENVSAPAWARYRTTSHADHRPCAVWEHMVIPHELGPSSAYPAPATATPSSSVSTTRRPFENRSSTSPLDRPPRP